jgi:hypothetical protein
MLQWLDCVYFGHSHHHQPKLAQKEICFSKLLLTFSRSNWLGRSPTGDSRKVAIVVRALRPPPVVWTAISLATPTPAAFVWLVGGGGCVQSGQAKIPVCELCSTW